MLNILLKTNWPDHVHTFLTFCSESYKKLGFPQMALVNSDKNMRIFLLFWHRWNFPIAWSAFCKVWLSNAFQKSTQNYKTQKHAITCNQFCPLCIVWPLWMNERKLKSSSYPSIFLLFLFPIIIFQTRYNETRLFDPFPRFFLPIRERKDEYNTKP